MLSRHSCATLVGFSSLTTTYTPTSHTPNFTKAIKAIGAVHGSIGSIDVDTHSESTKASSLYNQGTGFPSTVPLTPDDEHAFMDGFTLLTSAYPDSDSSDSSNSSVGISLKKPRLHVLETVTATETASVHDHELHTLLGDYFESDAEATIADTETTISSEITSSDISDSDSDSDTDEHSGNSNHPPYSTLTSTNLPTVEEPQPTFPYTRVAGDYRDTNLPPTDLDTN